MLDTARSLAITRRAEAIREATTLSWERSCLKAEEEYAACQTLAIDFDRFCRIYPATVYAR